MRPSGVVAVLNDIVIHRRRCVVELGGGVSTFYIARLLLRRGGHLWTVEHDEQWAGHLEEDLTAEALSDTVTVIRAPLVPASAGWPSENDVTWYDDVRLGAEMPRQPVDLLVVDGPPAYQTGREHSRYPAARFFAPFLAEAYTIILDDIDRAGEQDIVNCWEKELGISFERRYSEGRIAVGRPATAFTI